MRLRVLLASAFLLLLSTVGWSANRVAQDDVSIKLGDRPWFRVEWQAQTKPGVLFRVYERSARGVELLAEVPARPGIASYSTFNELHSGPGAIIELRYVIDGGHEVTLGQIPIRTLQENPFAALLEVEARGAVAGSATASDMTTPWERSEAGRDCRLIRLYCSPPDPPVPRS